LKVLDFVLWWLTTGQAGCGDETRYLHTLAISVPLGKACPGVFEFADSEGG